MGLYGTDSGFSIIGSSRTAGDQTGDGGVIFSFPGTMGASAILPRGHLSPHHLKCTKFTKASGPNLIRTFEVMKIMKKMIV